MLKQFIQIFVAGGQVVGRAFVRAVRQEYKASQQAAERMNKSRRETSKMAAADFSAGMTVQEAKEILNVEDIHDPAQLEKNYTHLFEVNDKSKGGSLYLQSKVYRAKERIDVELKSSQTSSGASGSSEDPDKKTSSET